jgi:hypothetical protein
MSLHNGKTLSAAETKVVKKLHPSVQKTVSSIIRNFAGDVDFGANRSDAVDIIADLTDEEWGFVRRNRHTYRYVLDSKWGSIKLENEHVGRAMLVLMIAKHLGGPLMEGTPLPCVEGLDGHFLTYLGDTTWITQQQNECATLAKAMYPNVPFCVSWVDDTTAILKRDGVEGIDAIHFTFIGNPIDVLIPEYVRAHFGFKICRSLMGVLRGPGRMREMRTQIAPRNL